MLKPIPPRAGTLADFAWRLSVQAAAGLAGQVPETLVEALRANAHPSSTAAVVEDDILKGVQNWISSQVEMLAEYGGSTANGRASEPYDALAELAAASRRAAETGTVNLTAPEPGAQASPAEKVTPLQQQQKRSRPMKAVRGRLDEGELKKGLKYILSTTMELRIAATSTLPLQLTLVPGAGYEGRYEDALQGTYSSKAKEAGRTVMLRALLDVVERLDAPTCRRWLPEVSWDRLDDPEVEKGAMKALAGELKRRLLALLDLKGVDAFERYAAGAG